MKNELNIYLMSADEVIRWYKPQTEEESYLVDLLSTIATKTAKELQDEVDDLRSENEDLENDKSKLEDDNLDLILENARLQKEAKCLKNH